MSYPKRLIEVDLPIARISAHARREKSIRHGHISTLHIWWARRPLAACRAVICASLWPDPADPNCPPAFREAALVALSAFARRVNPERITAEMRQLQETLCDESRARWEDIASDKLTFDVSSPADMSVLRMALLDFIADFANWDNSTVPAYLETSRALTQTAHEALGGITGTRPLVVDPFAGGGSIPLESLRVGADAFASDVNPVAYVLNKVALEYAPRYGQSLADEVRKWGNWIKDQASLDLAKYYPVENDGSIAISYLWARTIISEAPGENALPVEVPVFRSMWLVKKHGRRLAIRWAKNKQGEIRTETVVRTYADGKKLQVRRPLIELFEPETERDVTSGTVARGSVTCPLTGFTTPVGSIRKQLSSRKGGSSDARMLAVVTVHPNRSGREYRLANDQDAHVFESACIEFDNRTKASTSRLSLLPNEIIPETELRRISIPLYGLESWGDCFSARQALSLTHLQKLTHLACAKAAEEYQDPQFGLAVKAVLALAIGRQTDYTSTLVTWSPQGEKMQHTFSRQALGMVWDFAEGNPWSASTGCWSGAFEWGALFCEHVARSINNCGTVARQSACEHSLPDDSAAALVTDPPYYDAVPYAHLSDYFFVWLRRSLGDNFAEGFNASLTPKSDEIVVDRPHRLSKSQKDIAFYERNLQIAFSEARRILAPTGIATIVFASKTTSSWEAILNAVVASGWVITGSWPIDTEMENRIAAQGQARLASSVHLVCRPREDASGAVTESVGEWRDVLGELPKRIHEWMPRLASEGVVGADAIFACLGPALEVFSRYSRVEKANGETATLREYLEHVWAAVSTEALSLIFKDASASGLEPDARLTAMWLWTICGGANGNGKNTNSQEADQTAEDDADDDESSGSGGKVKTASGFVLEYDAARKIAQGLGVHLEQCDSLVEVKGDKARLLPVAERTSYLFGKETHAEDTRTGRKKKIQQRTLFAELDDAEAAEAGWTAIKGPPPGATVLDRVHQAMILFAANRGELIKRFLVDDGVGKDDRFWKLADNLNKLYPPGTEERRWVEGVLARKKGLGF